jgi:hypothetical protein
LLAGVFGVFYWLPNQLASSPSPVNEREDLAEADSSATKHPPIANVDIDSLDIQQLAQAKEAAENALRNFMRQQKVLDDKAVSLWGGERYSTTLENASAADDFFQKQQFERATQAYQVATTTLNALVDLSDEVLGESLTAGAQALEKSNPAKAQAPYAHA